ncbi:putative ribonuclease H-like domain-containing protein [Tanacetum coccineum]
MTHPSPKRNMVPKVVLMRPIKNKTATKNSDFNQRVNIVSGMNVNTDRPKAVVNATRPKAVLNAVKGNQVNAVKASACWVWKPKTKDQGLIDSGCSRHMTGNMSYLTDFEEIDGGYVSFEGNPKGGKITGRGKIKTGNLDFENVYFVPRKNNMYSVDLKNIVPKGGLTCLFVKATSDKSKLWHRRLGHINFKTMNKLVKENLVRGLPLKLFENDQTCVACQKGKQHRASCKSKILPKDETSGILKSFITRVENLIDQMVKVIRCDNGTEFKNKKMNQFCKRKCIKREFSVARTPQQNRVAERKNRTLIEATRIMLTNSKLPTTFWAKAVNTACYVKNRVLVTKPHNKTPYELFLGRKLALGFMRPSGYPVTILNAIDHLGKFDGKADEGFFVGYSINSKAFRVFNSRTRIGKARMETVPGKDYILLPLWPADPSFSQNSKSSPDAGFKPLGDNEKKVTKEPGKEGGDSSNDQEKEDDNVNSTNNVNTASDGNSTNNINAVSSTVNAAGIEVNAIGVKTSIELLDDPNMPELEDIVYSDDAKDVGAEADMNNLNTFMPVSPIPTTRIHKDHPVEQIIGDLNSTPQTRRMTKNLKEHEEPKKVIHALKDPSWIEAIQEELLQFKLQEV